MIRPLVSLLVALLVAAPAAAAEIDAARAEVERIRGLEFERSVEVIVLPRTELRKTLEAQIAKDASLPLADYMDVLAALHLIERREGALDALMEVYEAQVLAFYDPSTGTYTTFDTPPGGLEAAALLGDAVAVHELTHALQDQVFDAGDRLKGLESSWDAQLAYHAVLEGEATLVMLAGLMGRMGVSLEDIVANDELVATMNRMADMAPGMPADAPPYFVESLKFPYLRGLSLVIEAYRHGGWDAVDRLHENPPRNTEVVLRPGLYFARVENGRAAAASPGGCPAGEALLATTLGEFHWSFLLGDEAGRGWESDCVRASREENAMAVDGTSSWESEADAEEFAAALRTLLAKRDAEPRVERDGTVVAFGWRTGPAAAAVAGR